MPVAYPWAAIRPLHPNLAAVAPETAGMEIERLIIPEKCQSEDTDALPTWFLIKVSCGY
jgi:hypothetical protein